MMTFRQVKKNISTAYSVAQFLILFACGRVCLSSAVRDEVKRVMANPEINGTDAIACTDACLVEPMQSFSNF